MQFIMEQNFKYDQTLLPSIMTQSISASNCYQYRLPYLQTHQYFKNRNYKTAEQSATHDSSSKQMGERSKNNYLRNKKNYGSSLSHIENQNWQKKSYDNKLLGSRLNNRRYQNGGKRQNKNERLRAISHISRVQKREQQLYQYLQNAKTEQKVKNSKKDSIIKPKSSFPKLQQKNNRSVSSSSIIKNNQEQQQDNSKHKFKITFVNQKTQFLKNRRTFLDIYYANKKENKIIGKMDPRIPFIPQKDQLQEFIINYKSTNQEINISSLLKANFCVVQYSPLQLYIGEMISKHKHGRGIYITPQSCFQGFWKNNEKVKGIQITTTGIFQGTYKNNLRHGQGQFQKHTGDIYIGEWAKGKKHGNGLWVNIHGQSYNGQWKEGKPQGKGTLTLKDRLYKGYFYNFKEEGFGRELFPNGDTFEGIYKEGLPNGRGIYQWKNKCYYIGPFESGLRSGIGEFHKQKTVFRGLFVEDRLQGKCQIMLSNGKVYDGRCKKELFGI